MEYENSIIKKAEHQRIDAFELRCWRRLSRVPPTARRSNQSILKEIKPEYWLEGLMLALKLLWPPDAESWLIRKDPDAGKHWGQEEKWLPEDEMVGWNHCLHGHEFEQTLGDSKGQGSLLAAVSEWGAKSCKWLNDRTTDSILKSRHYFAYTGPYSLNMVFAVVMYGCENWTIRKAEHRRIYAF